ncbi:hypothetical protein [Halomicronema sp. CCY15110]|uniref:hypothetical protein n=1 Tax=Halomicronema sp. CCY15110 TaxID=2767773 RepID=UPI0019513232|nr:hypothetical protein [Halomicronema sp. CCY15110]
MTVSFQAFRDRYPEAQIISELLLVERDRFVVKVTITTASSGTASGLAAHNAIEVAEDQARLRALAALGYAVNDSDAIGNSLHPEGAAPSAPPARPNESPQPHQSIDADAPSLAIATPPLPQIATSAAPAVPHASNSHVAKPKPSSPKPAKVATSQTVEKIHPQPAAIEPPPVNLDGDDFDETIAPLEESIPSPTPHSLPDATVAPISTEALPAPINLSDVIAQTDIELRRLGWSVETGREYLEQTYQKRSRHELSEEELIQFLCHLESL